MDIIVGSVHVVLADILGMSKLSARWVPQMLTPDQKVNRLEISRTLLGHFQADTAKILRRFATEDKTSVHHFEPMNQRIKANTVMEPHRFSASQKVQTSGI